MIVNPLFLVIRNRFQLFCYYKESYRNGLREYSIMTSPHLLNKCGDYYVQEDFLDKTIDVFPQIFKSPRNYRAFLIIPHKSNIY